MEARLAKSPRLARERAAIMRKVTAQFDVPPAARSRPSRIDGEESDSGARCSGRDQSGASKNEKKGGPLRPEACFGPTHRVADRPDRFEPRMSKRKPKGYNRLTKPRKDIKREMIKGLSKI
jgi:hypothetical protein